MSGFKLIHVSIPVLDSCINENLGELCVRCNCCGRFDEVTKYKAQLTLYKDKLMSLRHEENKLNTKLDSLKKDKDYYLEKIKLIKDRIDSYEK